MTTTAPVQLFNVLLGDMSLVGPRPERPQFVEKFREEIPRYMIKHQVRPGMTGWVKKLRPQVIMALLPAWNLAMNAANATVLKIISRLEPVTKQMCIRDRHECL